MALLAKARFFSTTRGRRVFSGGWRPSRAGFCSPDDDDAESSGPTAMARVVGMMAAHGGKACVESSTRLPDRAENPQTLIEPPHTRQMPGTNSQTLRHTHGKSPAPMRAPAPP